MDGNTAGTATGTSAIMPSHQSTSISTGETPKHEIIQSFNCALCSISFTNSIDQRTHMKSPWHIYNLKRRIVSLPPLSQTIFTSRIENSKLEDVECPICEETFESAKEYQLHLKSRDHIHRTSHPSPEEQLSDEESDGIGNLAKVASRMGTLTLRDSDTSGSEIGSSSSEADEEVEFDETICLFCLHPSESLEINITHMETTHSFFIPSPTALHDIASFLSYLHTLIAKFYECVSCSRVFDGDEAARTHMCDAGHCRVDKEDEELRDFWVREEDGGKGKEKELLGGEEKGVAGASPRVLRRRGYARRKKQISGNQLVAVERSASPAPNSNSEERAESTDNTNPETSGNSERAVALGSRNEMGLVGLSDPERRALRVMEKKVLKVEMRSRKKFRAGLDRKGEKANIYGLRMRKRHVGDHVMDWK